MDIPIIAQSNETSTTGTVGPPGVVEPGPGGPLVLKTWWSSGTVVLMVLWYCAYVGLWYSGTVVLMVLWYYCPDGTLILRSWWSSGIVDLVVLWYCGPDGTMVLWPTPNVHNTDGPLCRWTTGP